jgi:predicted esterase
MHRIPRLLAACLWIAWTLAPAQARANAVKNHYSRPRHFQETGFLNRTIVLRGTGYRFQVYLPEDWQRDDHKLWPIILFLHGRGERGSEGMWQTQIGLPEAVRDHPERWPFIIVMPQCPQDTYWTDPENLAMAMSTLDQETDEFHGDPARTYLTGLSLGGYGAWELARLNPKRWAAIAIASGGIFWSYAPERWREISTLPAEYARSIGRTPIWLFHGSDDPIVPPREDELMYAAFKASGGNIRLWLYQGLKHDCWTRAYDDPELPRWLLSHRREPPQELTAFAERLVIPQHPSAIRLTTAQLEALAGDYRDTHGQLAVTLFREGDHLYEKDLHGQVAELAAESNFTLFYPNGSSITRIAVEHDALGRVTGLILRDDRHEERWEKRVAMSSR